MKENFIFIVYSSFFDTLKFREEYFVSGNFIRLDNFKKIMIGYDIFVYYSILYAWLLCKLWE